MFIIELKNPTLRKWIIKLISLKLIFFQHMPFYCIDSSWYRGCLYPSLPYLFYVPTNADTLSHLSLDQARRSHKDTQKPSQCAQYACKNSSTWSHGSPNGPSQHFTWCGTALPSTVTVRDLICTVILCNILNCEIHGVRCLVKARRYAESWNSVRSWQSNLCWAPPLRLPCQPAVLYDTFPLHAQ